MQGRGSLLLAISRQFGNFRLKYLVTGGLVVSVGLAGMIGLFGRAHISDLAGQLDDTAQQSVSVSDVLAKLTQGSEAAAAEAVRVSNEMEQQHLTGMRSNAADMEVLQKSFEKLADSLKQLIDSGEEDAILLMLELETIHETVTRESLPRVRTVVEQIVESTRHGEMLTQDVVKMGNEVQSFVAHADEAFKISEKIKQDAVASAQDAEQDMRSMLWVMIVGVGVMLVVAVNTYIVIISPLRELRMRVRDIAEGEGDLTVHLDDSARNEFGELAGSFNTFIGKLRILIYKVQASAEQLAQSAEDMLRITEQTNVSIMEQQLQTDQVATSINQMASTVDEISHNAAQAENAARLADSDAKNGNAEVAQTMVSINALTDEIEKAAQVITEFEKDSSNIGGVLDVIKGIAEQTNLLALNAAIEAARAGEQGRGFAVVADEVRTLATRTQTSTAEIQVIIQRLQSGAKNAVQAMEEGRTRSQATVKQAEKTRDCLGSITAAVASISELNSQIASATEEQAATTAEVNRNVVVISDSAQATSGAASEMSAKGEALSHLARELRAQVMQFKA